MNWTRIRHSRSASPGAMRPSTNAVLCLLASFLALFLSFLAINVTAYSTGAPLGEACRTLYPGHGVDKQYGRATYRVSAMRRHNDSNIVVTIYSPTDTFLGFIMQARLYSDREMLVNGAFSTDQYSRALDCLGGFKVSPLPSNSLHSNCQSKHCLAFTEFSHTHGQLSQVQSGNNLDTTEKLCQRHYLSRHSGAVKERLLDGYRLGTH